MITGAAVVAAAAVIADGDDDFGAGFIAFVVVVALCIATYFLFRSMNKHLKGLPARFAPPSTSEDPSDPAHPTLTSPPSPPGPPKP